MNDKTEPAAQSKPKSPPKKVNYVLLQRVEGVGRKGEIHLLCADALKAAGIKVGEHCRAATGHDLAVAGKL